MVETTNTATPVATGTPQDFNLQVLNTDYGANTNLESMTASADQVFADFVGSYTSEQQQVIFDEISKHLYATQGNCNIRWHGVGEDKKDYVRTTYSDGQLIEFEMRNRDVGDRQSQDSRIVFRTDNNEAYLKYKEKVKNAAGKNKKAAQVEIDSDGLNLKGRQTASSSSLGLSGAQHSRQSQSSQLIRDDVAGTTNIRNTQNKMEAHADLSGVYFGYERTSNSMEFDADGNPLAAADSRTSVDAGTSGFSATASGSNTTYDADGGRHTSGYNAGLAFNGDGFNLNGGITYQTFDVNGIMLNETNLQAGAGMSVAGFTANFGAKSMRLDENGTLINRGFTAQALIGTGNFGANISTQTAIAYADGHQVNNGFGFGANFGSAGTNLSYNKNYRFITQEGYVLNQTEAGFAAGYTITADGLSLQYSHSAKEMTAGIITRNTTSSYMANLSTGHIDLTQTITDQNGNLQTRGIALSGSIGWENGIAATFEQTFKGNSTTYSAQASIDGVPQGEIAQTKTEITPDGVNTESKGLNTNQIYQYAGRQMGINLSDILQKDAQKVSELAQRVSAPVADKAKVTALMQTNSQNAGNVMEQITPENVQASVEKPENTATDTKAPTSTIPLQRGGGYDSYG
jgi:hypothetical protein